MFCSRREFETAEFRYCEVHDSYGCALCTFICPLEAHGPFLRKEKDQDGLVSLTETRMTL